jgi:ATP-binding cassette subfamily B protein
MTIPPEGLRGLFAIFRWSWPIIWTTGRTLVIASFAVAVLRGMLPAALALTARELINTAFDVIGAGQGGIQPVLPWLAIGFALTTMEAVSMLTARYLTLRLEDDLTVRVTTDVLEHAATLEVGFFEDKRHRDLIQRAQQNLGARLAQLVAGSLQVTTDGLRTMSLAGVIISIEPLVLLVLPPFAVPFFIFQWRLAKLRYAEEHQRTTKRRWTEYFVNTLTGAYSVAETRVLDLAPLLIERFRCLMAGFRDRNQSLHLRNLRGSVASGVLTAGVIYLLFVRVAARTITGAASIGDLAIFGGAAMRLRNSLDLAIRSLTSVYEHALFTANLKEFLQVEPGLQNSTTSTVSLDRGEIELHDVSFTYPGSSEPALRGVSLRIAAGETMAIVGENGAGKSTLAKLLARLYEPDEGRILFDGVNISDVPRDELRRKIGVVFQSHACYEATVAENIAYGDWRRLLEDRDGIEEIARRTNADVFVRDLEHGYDTLLGREFGEVTLSGGQWQRIATARAFARDAALLILDEPTSSLDSVAEHELFTRFKKLSQGRTTLLISHRFTTLGMADRIAVMSGGSIVEVGSHDELKKASGAYAALYALQRSMKPR